MCLYNQHKTSALHLSQCRYRDKWCFMWYTAIFYSLLQSGRADLGVVAVCRHQELQAGRGSQVSSKHLVWLHWSDPRNCWSFLPLSWLVSCLRDQVELADGDALVPVAHFSKEVCFFVSFYFVASSCVQCSICWYFKFQVFSTFGSPFLVLMRQVRIALHLHLQDLKIVSS